MSIKIVTIGPGMAQVVDRITEDPILSLERHEISGRWFAYPVPSHADQMAQQSDRAEYAIAWAPTRCQCVQDALVTMRW